MNRTKEENARTENAIYNIVTTSFTSVVSLVISFLSRFIFLKVLDATYLGVSGLFSNILLIFSLVELGMGAALTQMFYKPFAEKDYTQLSIVTHTTKVILNIIGCVIILLTLIFTPFLRFFVNDMNAVPNMRLIFFLYGISSSVTYFWGYFRTIITANQEAYKLVKVDFVWKIVTFIGQIVVLFSTKNFILYLITQICLNVGQNFLIKKLVQNRYNYIDYNCKKYLSHEEAKYLVKNVAALSLNRLSLVVTNGTDNILISKFLNLKIVGYASNYTMIAQSVSSLLESLFGPLLASIGNLCVSESEDKKYEMFNSLSFAAFWLYGFCSITAFCLAEPFINFVFGTEYIISSLAAFFLCFDIFCVGMTRVSALFRTAEGLFWQGRYRPLLQALINLLLSLILVQKTHMLWAVYAGTVLSRIFVNTWYDPYVVLKYGMNRSPWKYYVKEFLEFSIYFVVCAVVWVCTRLVTMTGILQIVIVAILCIVMINGMFLILCFKTKEFRYWKGFLETKIRQIFHKE